MCFIHESLALCVCPISSYSTRDFMLWIYMHVCVIYIDTPLVSGYICFKKEILMETCYIGMRNCVYSRHEYYILLLDRCVQTVKEKGDRLPKTVG